MRRKLLTKRDGHASQAKLRQDFHQSRTRIFHELVFRDREDGRAIEGTMVDCSMRLADSTHLPWLWAPSSALTDKVPSDAIMPSYVVVEDIW